MNELHSYYIKVRQTIFHALSFSLLKWIRQKVLVIIQIPLSWRRISHSGNLRFSLLNHTTFQLFLLLVLDHEHPLCNSLSYCRNNIILERAHYYERVIWRTAGTIVRAAFIGKFLNTVWLRIRQCHGVKCCFFFHIQISCLLFINRFPIKLSISFNVKHTSFEGLTVLCSFQGLSM